MLNNLIKPVTLFTLLLLSLSVTSHANDLTGCAAQEQQIKTQLSYAEKYGDKERLKGLKIALQKVTENCTDESLKAKRMEKIAKYEAEVAERKQDLIEATNSGKLNKVDKKERKLQEAMDELQEAKNTLPL
ncbi:MAG: DUF1090 domain-containing protein [Flavobacteriaceae bacterium]|uniref:DUF1090 domain-containing protein n=1 Tax=Aliivibrio sp. TaxID=1872443 RepID=UPI001A6355DA|nr:DUF1090 domain-containing protein [Flavobacteriaceae bacterium]MBL4828582.1 DUF1090 domain-containing protein [Aliivibrio sp.]